MKILSLSILFIILLISISCGKKSTTSTASSSSGKGTVVSTAVQNTAPHITASSDEYVPPRKLDDKINEIIIVFDSDYDEKNIVLKGDTWTTGSGNYEIFNLLRKYTYPADEGVLDMTNMYKALHEIKSKVDGAESTCNENPFASKSVVPPYTGFSGRYNFTCGYNSGTLSDSYAGGFTMDLTNGVYYILYGWQWASNANGGSVGTAQAKYDTVNNTLFYEMVNCVNCGGSSNNFTVRTELDGNPSTHLFTIRTISRSASGYKAIVGKGYSQGNGNYMLLKYTTDGTNFKYYCVPSTATQTDFAAATGETSVPSNCSTYATDVNNLTFFTTSNVPFALSDFTNSTILLTL